MKPGQVRLRRYTQEIVDPLHNRVVGARSARWLNLAPCRDAGVEAARALLVESAWPVIWVLVRNRDGDVLRHLSVFRDQKGVARNRHLEDRR